MTNVHKENSGQRKLLVPVIALLLCAFAMVGAGYAFLASSASSTGNTLEGDVISMKITGSGETPGWSTISAGYVINYGFVNDGGDNPLYYTNKAAKVGFGTLEINTKYYEGDMIKVAGTVAASEVPVSFKKS